MDLAQYLQVLPGVIFTGDQGGQLYIRGGSPIQNKVGQFVSSKMIRNITGHKKSTIDLEAIMNEGKILLQKSCTILPLDSADDIANKVHALEYEWYPKQIEAWITKLSS